MNYLLYGIEEYLIDMHLNNIIKKNAITQLSINRYDLQFDSIKGIIDDCKTISLFEDKKIVVVDNCNYFNRVKNNEEDVSLLLDYISNYNDTTILVIISHNETIDNTKKITKKIKMIGEVIECNEASPKAIIKKLCTGYKISDGTIDLLIKRVGSNMAMVAQEVEKLKTYKYDEREINDDDVINCATNNIDTDIFKFIDNIIGRQKEVALTTYYELLKSNEEPIKIIALLASKFRLMYQVKILNGKGMNNNEMAKLLGIHAYPVKLALETSKRYSSKLLLNCLKGLANLDQDIKTGQVNPELGLELFILNV